MGLRRTLNLEWQSFAIKNFVNLPHFHAIYKVLYNSVMLCYMRDECFLVFQLFALNQ